MGLSLFRAFLVINVFSIGTENPITPKPYRFSVYPVNKCPGSKTEFQRASQRMNCTKDLRYLCAPNKYLSSLIEFCTDRKRSLYGKGNCVVLEGEGDLDHYRCVEKFNRSCPSTPYYDEEIYKYPACLEIDKELRCFIAENGCNKREFLTTETSLNISKMETVGNETNLNISNMETFGNETSRGASHGLLAIGYMIAIAVVLAVIILIWIIFQIRKKEQVKKCKDNNENESLLKDSEPPIDENDRQLHQESVNISKQNQMQITEMLSERAKRETRSKSIQEDEKQNKESEQNAAAIDVIQQDNPEIDDDKLRQFLSKGEITVCHVRCIIVGCGKAGKTTLLKRLQNVSFDELMQIKRTKIVDFHVNSFEVLLEEETIQSVGKEDTVPTILFSKENLEMPIKDNDGKMAEEAHQPSIRKKNVSEKSSLKNTTLCQIENIPMDILNNQANNDNAEDEKKNIFEPHSQDTTLVQNQLFPEPNEKHGEDIDAIVDQNDFEQYAILKIKDDVNELLNETDLRPRITFLDFAGQSMYYAFHQIFLRPKSCSILVMDMTKSLDDKVGVQDENEKECSQFASWRYRDYYKFWLRSIDVFSDTESPVIIVGTHADKLSKEECRNFRESLLIFFDSWCHSDIQRHVNADRIHTIGFPDSGSELEDLKELKKCIANIVKSPRYSKENIRPVWAFFEHILNKMKKNKKVISRKTLSDYVDQLTAQEFRIDESEISKMLDFFHRVGVLLYFDKDGLKENIILDIQWLIDAFKCIIEYHVRPEENDKKRRQFYHTGKLDNVELNRIWNVKGKYFLEHKTTIIAYMQQLGLLMPLKELHPTDSSGYYFPSMNSKRFDKTGEKHSKSSILCFKFDDEMQLPINVFYGIVLKCSKLNNWSILTEGAKNNICLYQNAACFSFQKHVVVLCNCNFEIRVQVWASPNIYDERLLKKIKHSVKDIIHDDDLLSYEIGYKCRKDVLNVEEDVSFISQSTFPVSNHLCEICDVDNKHEVDNEICWDIEENDENQGSPVSYSDNGSGTLNAQMEGREDGETYVKTSVQKTDILQSNSDLVGDIGFLPNSEQHNVTHTESNRHTVIEAHNTNMLNIISDNDTIGVPDTEGDSEIDHIHNIDEHASPAIAVVLRPPMNGDKKETELTDFGYSRKYKNIRISVKEGVLAKEQVDVIVNSTSDTLNLRYGRESLALLDAAGAGLQTECKQKYPTGIQKGDVAVTRAGNLRCKFIFHGSLKRYGSQDAEKIHMAFISKCLKELDNMRLSSIAFPGLTTGLHKFPKKVAAKNTCCALAQYIDANPNTRVTEVRFVIHAEDKETYEAFCDAIKMWDLNPNLGIERKEICRFKMNQISVTIKVDKIEEERVDMIVNIVNRSINLDKGSLCNVIITAAGTKVAEECQRDHPSGVSEGNVVVTSAGYLKCEKLCHACVPPHEHKSNDVSVKVLQKIVIKCLEKADKKQLISVALPALGTRYNNYPARVSATGVLKGIDQFSKSHSRSSVKSVVIVLYGGNQHEEILKAFVNEAASYQRACSGPERGTQEFCRQQYYIELHPPEYWTQYTSNKSFKSWKVDCEDVSFKLLDVDSTTYKAVENLVQSTWQSKNLGHGRDALGLSVLNYTSVKVLKVQRLENIDLYENYCHFRSSLLNKAGVIGVFEPLFSISQGSKAIFTTESLKEDSVLKKELYPEINEHFLFHGTKTDTYKKILSQGLDFRMAKEYGMFGQGVYLAESSTKADQYTDLGTTGNTGEKRMFLARTCLGKIHLAKAKKERLQRPPCFQTGCESDSCEHSERQRCDSVVGEGEWLFREFVTYHHYQTYPEYLITYDRV